MAMAQLVQGFTMAQHGEYPGYIWWVTPPNNAEICNIQFQNNGKWPVAIIFWRVAISNIYSLQ